MSLSQLKDLYTYARAKVPYYKNIFQKYNLDDNSIQTIDDLQRLPLLNRKIVQENFEDMLSEDKSFYPLRDNIIIKRTSGSTGTFLKVLWNKYDYIRSVYHLSNLRKTYYDISPSSKFCSFNSQNNNLNEINWESIKGIMLNINKIVLDEEFLNRAYRSIIRFEPSWLFIQPSVAYMLANFIDANKLEIPKSLRYIELMGEYALNGYQEKIRDIFGVPVAKMYGCTECNGIGLECPRGNIHCISGNVIVEVIKDGYRVNYGETGEIYITCLTNYVMPFIRYATGDRGILYPSTICDCGDPNPVLKILAGRINDNFITVDNKRIDSFTLINLIEKLNKNFDNAVWQFKAVQESRENITLYIVINKAYINWLKVIKEHLLQYIKESALSKFEWNIQFKEVIDVEKSGKCKFIVNLVEN